MSGSGKMGRSKAAAPTAPPAVVKGVWQVDLELELADELTDALNWLADQAPATGDVT